MIEFSGRMRNGELNRREGKIVSRWKEGFVTCYDSILFSGLGMEEGVGGVGGSSWHMQILRDSFAGDEKNDIKTKASKEIGASKGTICSTMSELCMFCWFWCFQDPLMG